MDENINIIHLSHKKCSFIAKGYFDEGDEQFCLFWLFVSELQKFDRVALISKG